MLLAHAHDATCRAAPRTMMSEQQPSVTWESPNRPARTAPSTPCLSYTTIQPTRQPGTRNSFAMPPTDSTGTVAVSDAMGKNSAPENTWRDTPVQAAHACNHVSVDTKDDQHKCNPEST